MAKTLADYNKECQRCRADFAKSGCRFSPSMCKTCPIGRAAHELQCKTSEAERQWDEMNWTASQNKKYYKG